MGPENRKSGFRQARGSRHPLLLTHDVFFGASSYIRDLDGHIWELAYNRDFPFTEDGRLDLPTPQP